MSPVKLAPRERTAVALVVAALLIAVLVIVLSPRRKRGPPQPSAIELAQGWLECIDCQGPFLRRLSQLRPASRDSVVRFLRGALLQGPDSARRTRHERDLARAWVSDSVYRARMDLADASNDQHKSFLKRYREGFHTKWRGRAATALGVIRTGRALAVLDSALQAPDTSFGDSLVRREIERARSDSTGPEAVDFYPYR